MASRHVRWVLANRDRYTDAIDREIMVTIASHIGSDDRPATMSMATIADYVGCHYNTVDKRTKSMAEDGQLVIEKRGRYLAYSLPGNADDQGLAGDEPQTTARPDCRNEEIVELYETIEGLRVDVKELREIVTSLSHDLHTIVTSPSHDLHMSVTSDQRNDVNKEGKKGRREGGGIYTRGGFAEEVDNGLGGEADRVALRTEMLAAVTAVAKEPYVRHRTEEDFDAVVDAFVDMGVTPDQVMAFEGWWKENGNYSGRPALTSLQNNIRNSVAGVSARASPAGNGHMSEPKGFAAIRAVMQELDDE